MSHINLEFVDLDDLREQVSTLHLMFFGAPLPAPANDPAVPENLALFTSEELAVELNERSVPAPDAGANPVPDQAAKRKRGRPPKDKGATPEPANEAQATAATEEPAPAAEAVPNGPVEPSKDAHGVAPNLPTEDQMLALLSEVYSDSGDMELVRGIMREVGGDSQLSLIAPGKWPALHERLSQEKQRLAKGNAA